MASTRKGDGAADTDLKTSAKKLGEEMKRNEAKAASTTGPQAQSKREPIAPDVQGLETPAKRAARTRHELAEKRHDEEVIRRFFESGEYPYKTKMPRAAYETHKAELQVELLKVQRWVKETGQRVMILFEGRDAAGKGGTIKRFMEHLNPRGARVVALEKPTEMERGQWYFQRYVRHFPTAGEIVLFDRSWYNRAGVERVMGFCNAQEYLEFMRQAPDLERMLVRSGIRLFKYWFSVTQDEQRRRFDSQGCPIPKRARKLPRVRTGSLSARVRMSSAPVITSSGKACIRMRNAIMANKNCHF